MRIKQLAKGCRIIDGAEAALRRRVLSGFAQLAGEKGFTEVVLPSLEPADIYTDRAGPEVLGQMYVFEDRGGRKLCLRPEGTATCQLIAQATNRRDVKLWYEARCWRYEQPQAGRYREFTQFGVEWLNPRDPAGAADAVYALAQKMLGILPVEWHRSVKRGLAYYTDGGFEATCERLGAQKQVLGGGPYPEGVGFAIGVDRVVLAMSSEGGAP